MELLIVLLLLGLSAMLVAPSIGRGLSKLEVRRSALKLAAVIRDLRGRAIYEGMYQRLIIDPQANSYEILRGEKIRLASAVRIAAIEGGEPLGEGKRQFIFFPNGRMFGGEIELLGTAGSSSYTIRLNPIAGRVRVTRGNGRSRDERP